MSHLNTNVIIVIMMEVMRTIIMLILWTVRENQCKFGNGVALCKQDWFVIILSQ